MAKTPGTHSTDDKSQQPRQTETPSPRERSAIANEDRTRARDKLAAGQRNHARKHNHKVAKSGS